MRYPLALVFFFFLSVTLVSKTSDQKMVEEFEKKFSTLNSFQAHFSQVIRSKFMETEEKSQGKIFVQKPGKLRWESESEGGTQIINGKKLWNIQPKARKGKTLVTYYEDFTEKADPKLLLFLTGGLKLLDHYQWKKVSDSKETLKVTLTPKKPGGDSYLAEINKKNYFLASLSYETPDTETKLVFSKLVFNSPLEAKLFEYKANSDDIVQKQ